MTQQHPIAPETKMADEPVVTDSLNDIMHAFESYKASNDQRVDELETRKASDPLTEEKLERINKTMDQLLLKQHRPSLGDSAPLNHAQLEHKAAFDTYLRCGDDGQLRGFEQKAMSVGSPSDGGYLVPEELATDIGRRLAAISPIRALATVRSVSASVYKKPFSATGPAVGWVGETEARPETDSPALEELQFPTMELYAMPAATSTLLEDAAVDLDTWIAEEVETAFSEQEGAAFVDGNGVKKPRGFLDYQSVNESSWNWGKLGYVPTGYDGDLHPDDGADVLIDLIYSLKAGYRQNAHFVMNRKTQARLRKLKDADGNYLWQPPAGAGARAMLMGFPVVEAEDMPDISNNARPIAFGDFRRGYLVIDRTGVNVLRDPYTAKPYVLFYTTKRVGGGVQDFDAIKLVKIGVS